MQEYAFAGTADLAVMPSMVDRPAPPTEEVVPGAAALLPGLNYALPFSVDDLTRQLGHRAYEAMLTDAAVASSYQSLKLSVLDGGLRLVSPVKQPAWAKRPGAATGPRAGDDAGSTGGEDGRRLTPEQSLAAEVLAFCERSAERASASLGAACWELLDALAFGCKVAEFTFAAPDDGPDAGRLVLDTLKVKPNWAWRFVVDDKMNVRGFLTYAPLGGYSVFPAEKFTWLSWMPKDSDPRGTSCLRAAYSAWNLKVQAWPMYYAFLRRFGSPGLDFEMAENDTAPKPAIDAKGQPLNNGLSMEPGVFYATLLGVYANGGTFVHPGGSKLQVTEPRSKGEALLAAFDLFDRQIVLAIQHQVRATLEAKHGSRADSETAQDTRGLIPAFARDRLGQALRRPFYQLVLLNYGRDVADRLTPTPTFGNAEHQDRPSLWSAAASLGYQVGPSQLEEMDEELGLPIRDAAADARAAADAMEQQQTLRDTAKAGGEGQPPSGSEP